MEGIRQPDNGGGCHYYQNYSQMKRTNSFLLSALSCAALFSCSGCQEKPENGDNGVPEGNTEVTFALNQNDVLHNPLNGWVLYLDATADPSYFDKEIYNSELGMNVRIRDYASACYIRTEWKRMNPQDGVYFWQDENNSITKLVRRAEELGLPIAFRVIVDGRDRDKADGATPEFVRDAGAEVWVSNTSRPNWFTPIVMDPVFRSYYEKFVKAFAQEFNDPDRVAFIDAYGLGKWGEGHNVCYEQNNATSDKTEEYKENTMEWVTDLYSTTFTKVPLVINYHRHIGAPTGEGEAASPNSDKVLNIALSKGYCLRSDAFGMNDKGWGYNDWERSFVRNWNYKVPVIMEGGYIVSSHSYWNDPAGYRKGYPGDVRQGEYDASKEAKVNMMDFRVGAETESWFVDAFSLVKRFISEGGYRLYPDKVSVPASVASGSEVSLTSRWRNVGWGYFPNNLKQWNYKYKVAFALLDSDGEAAQVIVDQECEPSEWISGSTYSYELDASVEVPAGNYTWAVGIVDTEKDNEPAIDLAVKADKKTGRWVRIADVTVN